MKPEFALTSNARVVCLTHSKRILIKKEAPVVTDYSSYKENIKQNQDIFSLKNCKACNYFLDDSCSIGKKELRVFMMKLKWRRYKCKFCGSLIKSLYNVIYTQKLKQRYNVILPLLCCDCFEMLRSGRVKKAEKVGLLRFSMGLLAFSPLIIIPSLAALFMGASVSILLIILVPVVLVFLVFFISEYKRKVKLRKSLKNSDLLKNFKIGENN